MKKFKFKKRIKPNIFLYLFFLVIILYLIFGTSLNIKLFSSNEEFIEQLMKNSNYYIKYEENNNLVSEIVKLVFNYRKKEEKTITIVPVNEEMLEPKIYIYNSHQLENYSSYNYEPYNITPNVMMAAYILKEMFEKQNIPTIVENSNIIEYMNLNNYGFSYSYKASRYFLENKMKEYPSLEFFIDLHRDSINKANSTVVINNENYAKILFVVGLEHQNYKENLQVANSLNSMIKQQYPSLTRGVLTKQGKGVNGIYNQDLNKNMILLEVGGYQNTINEVYNTLSAIAPIIKEYLYGK